MTKITNDFGYKRPDVTLQDKLQTTESVQEKLEGYVEVDIEELSYLAPNTSIRYLTKKNGEFKFRLGGNLALNKKEYIVLKSSNNITWCVQKKDTIFYRALSPEERTSSVIDTQDSIIEEQQKQIEELTKINEELKKHYY